MLNTFIAGGLGLLGISISLFYSKKLHNDNKKFSKELHNDNKNFQEKILLKEKEQQHWRQKYDLLISLISFRHNVSSNEYSKAINGIPAIFYNSKNVIEAFKDFHNYQSLYKKDPSISNDKLIAIYEEIFKDLEIEEYIDKDLLYKTFGHQN